MSMRDAQASAPMIQDTAEPRDAWTMAQSGIRGLKCEVAAKIAVILGGSPEVPAVSFKVRVASVTNQIAAADGLCQGSMYNTDLQDLWVQHQHDQQ